MPLRTLPLTEQFLKWCQDFYAECDFVHMQFISVSVMALTVSIVFMLQQLFTQELTQDERVGTNLCPMLMVASVFYMCSILLMGTFTTGFKLQDETKVQFLFSLKTFLIMWALLTYTNGAVSSFIGLKHIESGHAAATE